MDTIAAIATPQGEGGLGIVRISGPKAINISRKLFKTSQRRYEDRHIYHGWIIDRKRPVDEVLLAYMKAPSTYTGEDIIEIHCHGGTFLVRHILDLVIKAGARLAEKGEFTKRAFLNGRIDLTRAEAVIDLIKAGTKQISHVAASQLKGSLEARINEIRGQLGELLTEMEASIDFPDEIGEVSRKRAKRTLVRSIKSIEQLINTSDAGAIVRDGISIAIVGRPNVGKSSLMNAILRRDRAIVTPEPGTTRDVLEEHANIKGIAARVFDTAGIRKTFKRIEKLGIERAIRALEDADIAILVLDSSEKLKPEDIDLLERTKDRNRIIVLNKTDKAAKIDLKSIGTERRAVNVSSLRGTGIDKLENEIVRTIGINKVLAGNADIMINLRHKQCLARAEESLKRSLDTIMKRLNDDLVAIDLKAAISSLGEITGEKVSEEVIESIFRRFCVGK